MRGNLSSGCTTVVSGMGVSSPLGLTSLASFAAFRASLTNFAETETIDRNGEPVRASYLNLIPQDRTRQERMIDLTNLALDDLVASAKMEADRRTVAFVALPDPKYPLKFDVDALTNALTLVIRNAIPTVYIRPNFFHQGRSAFFFALDAAMSALESAICEVAVVGAVDSLCDAKVLHALVDDLRLLGPSTPDGIIPGEGAGFMLLERSEELRTRQLCADALVLCVSNVLESRHFQQSLPNTGRALSMALRALREHPAGRGKSADLLYTCETGESFWTDEFFMAYLRNTIMMPEPFTRTMAAEAFGDLGAASGAVLLGMGIHALARYDSMARSSPPILLLCGSSDDGHIGACLVQGLKHMRK